MPRSSVSIVNFEDVMTGWVVFGVYLNHTHTRRNGKNTHRPAKTKKILGRWNVIKKYWSTW